LRKTDFHLIAEALKLDLWIITYFRVLPTDDRYLKMSDEQKYLLFLGFLDQPTPEQMKMNYERISAGPKLTEMDKSDLSRRGYSREAIERIQDNLKKAGVIQ